MREVFTQTGDEQFDVKLFEKYSKHLTSLMKIDKKVLDNMTEENKTVLFYNFFKFIQETYFEQFGIIISEEDDIVDYASLLLALDKNFAKKLSAYVNQYINFVRLEIKRKNKLKQKQMKKLENLRKEALALAKYLANPEMLKLMVLGHADENGNIIDYRSNDAMNIRMKTIWKLRGFMQENNMFSGGDAEKVIGVPKMDPTTYKGIIQAFNPDVFYTLGKEDVLNLVEGLVDGYCSMNGVKGPTIEARSFASYGDKKTLGSYADSIDTLFINKELISAIDKGRETKDPTLPMRIMQTSLHDARHKIQVANMNRTPDNDRDKEIASKMNASLQMAVDGNESYASYLSRIEEADARYVALTEMQQFADKGLLDDKTKDTLDKLYAEEKRFREASADKRLYESSQFTLSNSSENGNGESQRTITES